LKRTQEARFFVLRSLSQPEIGPPESELESLGVVAMERVVLPGHLDRTQIVRTSGPNELEIDEYARWAEPLEAGVARVVAENLSARLSQHRVVRYPWAGSTEIRYRVALELREFGPSVNGQVRLEGRWSLIAGATEYTMVTRPVALITGSAASAPQHVAAMSELLAQLSEQLAAAIRDLDAKTPTPPTGRGDTTH
jgi:hypothetical protein